MATFSNNQQTNTLSAVETQMPQGPYIDDARFFSSLPECTCAPILIVDDEPFNLIILEGLLAHRGFDKVDKAYNGQEALDKIKANC